MDNRFWVISAFVGPAHRAVDLANIFTEQITHFFESRWREGKNPRVIGLFASVQSRVLRAIVNEAISRNSDFVFLGRGPRGEYLRVRYFEGARISNEHLKLENLKKQSEQPKQ